jgi:LacI family transcriptional regulator
MATLKDISRTTGISVTQVSRALGGFPDVKAETRKKVEAAARDLGYRTNRLARGLKTGRSGTVAVVIRQPGGSQGTGVWSEIVWGLSEAFRRKGTRLLLYALPQEKDEAEAHADLFLDGVIDGFVLLDPVHGDRRISLLSERRIPFVVHDRDPTQSHAFVAIDNYRAGFDMAKRLVSDGHRRIAILNGPEETTFARDRSRGFADAIEEGAEAWESFGIMTFERGRAEALRILGRDQPPTAIIASSVPLARGVYDAAATLGLRIPDDLSVLAHQDGLASHGVDDFQPRICGTASPLSDAWSLLAEALSTAIENDGAPIKHMVRPEWVEGASCRRLL